MSSKTWSAAVIGLEAVPIEVEADVSQGLPKFAVVGLPDTAVQEARERVMAAIKHCGLPFPFNRLTVNLAPADLRKEGPAYDLPIAVAILLRGEVLRSRDTKGRLFIGELSLDGRLRPVSGVLPVAMMSVERGFQEIFLPPGNAAEACLAIDPRAPGQQRLKVYPVDSLNELVQHLRGQTRLQPARPQTSHDLAAANRSQEPDFDLASIRGQHQAKRALEIAAAGGHNLLLSGPPGAGKTLLARALPTILPEMTRQEMLEVTKIYSIAGLTGNNGLVSERPFRSPHHSASGASLIGGGTWPKPGEVSLAHRGILFLDEFPEFTRSVLENLRQPLEDGFVTVSRAQGRLRFPSQFILVAAQNPCPCGYSTDPANACSCSPSQIHQYRKRVSGPMLDRIDLHLSVPRLETKELFDERPSEPSAAVRQRVQAARNRQQARFQASGILTNAEMSQKLIRRHCRLPTEAARLLREATERLNLSARAYSRTLKIARTIADLAAIEEIQPAHVAESLQFREQAG